jgi:hypothetical protein
MSEETTEFPYPETNTNDLTPRKKDLLDLAMKTEHGTPLFKIRHFVGDAQITRYAKFKQMLLEIRAREEIIEQTIVSVEKFKARAAEAKEQLEVETSPAKRHSLAWEVTSLVNDVAKTERRLAMAYKERGLFIEALDEMYRDGSAYLDNGMDLAEALQDDYISEQLEAEHWTYRLGKQAALDLIATGHIGTGNLEAISMMNEDQALSTLRLALTYSNGMQKALGIIEKDVINELESGRLSLTTKIEKMETKKELEA